jgi:hypothetical protein
VSERGIVPILELYPSVSQYESQKGV